MTESSTLSKKRVLGAIAKSLVFWILFYFVILQISVLLGWNTIHPTVTHIVIKNISVPVETGEPEVVIEEKTEIEKTTLNDGFRKHSEYLRNGFEELHNDQIVALKDLQANLDTLHTNTNKHVDYPAEAESSSESISIISLSNLLKQHKISHLDDNTLQTLLDKSLEELRSIIFSSSNDRKSSSNIRELLLSPEDFVRENDDDEITNNNKKEEAHSKCPPPPPIVTRSSNLDEIISKFRHVLIKQTKQMDLDGKLNTNPIRIALEKRLDDPLPSCVDEQLEEAFMLPEETDEDEDTDVGTSDVNNETEQVVCLLEMDLTAMINLAMKNPAKKEDNLRTHVKELDDSVDIIFDAPLFSEFKQKRRQQQPPTNLRQVLDSDWFFGISTKCLDFLIDRLSGYFDILDNAIDNLAGSSDDAPVGRILTSNVFPLTKRIPFPNSIAQLYKNKKE